MAPRNPRTATIKTARLTLRPPDPHTDIAPVLARVQDTRCVQHLPHLLNAQHTEASVGGFLQACVDGSDVGSFYFMIDRGVDGARIGDGGFESLAPAASDRLEIGRSGEAGLMLSCEAGVRGRGFAEEAMAAVIAFGLREGGEGGLGLVKVVMRTRVGNKGWVKLMARMGIEGVEDVGQGEWAFEVTREDPKVKDFDTVITSIEWHD